jgi:protein-arginine kinase activator protein McsA
MLEPVVKVTTEDIKRYTLCKCCAQPANLTIVLGNQQGKKETVQSSFLCESCAGKLSRELNSFLYNEDENELLKEINKLGIEEETRG